MKKHSISRSHSSFIDPDEMGVDLDSKRVWFSYKKKPGIMDEITEAWSFIVSRFSIRILIIVFVLQIILARHVDFHFFQVFMALVVYIPIPLAVLMYRMNGKRAKVGKEPLQMFLFRWFTKHKKAWWIRFFVGNGIRKMYHTEKRLRCHKELKHIWYPLREQHLLVDWEAYGEHSEYLKKIRWFRKDAAGEQTSATMLFEFKKTPRKGFIKVGVI